MKEGTVLCQMVLLMSHPRRKHSSRGTVAWRNVLGVASSEMSLIMAIFRD
jgi:hypothetical protein